MTHDGELYCIWCKECTLCDDDHYCMECECCWSVCMCDDSKYEVDSGWR